MLDIHKAFRLIHIVECVALTCPRHSDSTVGRAGCPHTGRRQAHETRCAFRIHRVLEACFSPSSRAQLMIPERAHLLPAQRFASFCAAVIHIRRPTTFIASEVTWIDPGRAFVLDGELEVAQVLARLRTFLVGRLQVEQRRGIEPDGASRSTSAATQSMNRSSACASRFGRCTLS